jgi:hypothetical protein
MLTSDTIHLFIIYKYRFDSQKLKNLQENLYIFLLFCERSRRQRAWPVAHCQQNCRTCSPHWVPYSCYRKNYNYFKKILLKYAKCHCTLNCFGGVSFQVQKFKILVQDLGYRISCWKRLLVQFLSSVAP